MSKPINRRALLRYSALAGAGALTSPLWSGALPASAAGRSHRFSAGQHGPADLAAASTTDPVGTVTLDDLTITTSTAANSAQYVSNLVVEDVTVGGTPVTS